MNIAGGTTVGLLEFVEAIEAALGRKAERNMLPMQPGDDRGLRWNDPALSIDWPVGEGEALLSPKDGRQPHLAELGEVFCVSAHLSIACTRF